MPISPSKAPVVEGWQALVISPDAVRGWSTIAAATGTGVRLGSCASSVGPRGRLEHRHFTKKGDPIGFDFDLDNPADRTLYVALLAFLASLGVRGPLVEVGRPDGGATCRVKVLFAAAEDFPEGTPYAQTSHFIGHSAPKEGRAPSSRAVECYAAGRQFAVSGPNAKSGLPIEVRVDGVPAALLPPVAELPRLTSAQWIAALDFIDGGFGLGLAHAVAEIRPDNGAAPYLLGDDRRVADGREAAITRAAQSAVGLVFDSAVVPPRIYEDSALVEALATAVAWAVVERDVDLDRPRDGGRGAHGEHWGADDVAERVERAVARNAGRNLADRRARDAAGYLGADHPEWTLEQWVDALAGSGFSPIIAPETVEAMGAHETAVMHDRARAALAAATPAAAAPALAAPALAAAPSVSPEVERRRANGLQAPDDANPIIIGGLVNAAEVSMLVAPSGRGKTTAVLSIMAAYALGLTSNVTPLADDPRAILYSGRAPKTYFRPSATHVFLAYEGAQVATRVFSYCRDALGSEVVAFDPPSWWGLPPALAPAVRCYGLDREHPAAIIVDVPAARRLLPSLGSGRVVDDGQYGKTAVNHAVVQFVSGLVERASSRPGAPMVNRAVLWLDNLTKSVCSTSDASAVDAMADAMSNIAGAYGAGVCIIHHTTKDSSAYAGSVNIERFADNLIFYSRNASGRRVYLYTKKSRHSAYPAGTIGAADYAIAEDNGRLRMFDPEIMADPIIAEALQGGRGAMVRSFMIAPRGGFDAADRVGFDEAFEDLADVPTLASRADREQVAVVDGGAREEAPLLPTFDEVNRVVAGIRAAGPIRYMNQKSKAECQLYRIGAEFKVDVSKGSTADVKHVMRAVSLVARLGLIVESTGWTRGKSKNEIAYYVVDEARTAAFLRGEISSPDAVPTPAPAQFMTTAAPIAAFAPAPAAPVAFVNPFAGAAPALVAVATPALIAANPFATPSAPALVAAVAPVQVAAVAPAPLADPFAAVAFVNPFAVATSPAAVAPAAPVAATATRAEPTPEQVAEREARAFARDAMDARLQADAERRALLMPAARASSSIRWTIPERAPRGPARPREAAPKVEAPIVFVARNVRPGAEEVVDKLLRLAPGAGAETLPIAEAARDALAARMAEMRLDVSPVQAVPFDLPNVFHDALARGV